VVPAMEVLKQGNFVPSNLIMTGPGRLTLMDPVLYDVGLPHDDLAGSSRSRRRRPCSLPARSSPGPPRRRRDLEETFRAAAGPTGNDPRVLELRLLGQHVVRWVRRRGLSWLPEHGLPARTRRRLVAVHMRRILVEAAQGSPASPESRERLCCLRCHTARQRRRTAEIPLSAFSE
jgi:hypothetical protein